MEGPRLHRGGLGRCRGRGDTLGLLLGCVTQPGSGQHGGKGAKVPQHWGVEDRQSGPVRQEDMRAPLCCSLREGDTEARGFLSLLFHQHNCKSHKTAPLGRQPLPQGNPSSSCLGSGTWGEHPAREPWGSAGAWAASQGWDPSQPTHQPWGMPACVPWSSQLCHPPAEDTKRLSHCWCKVWQV